MRDIHFNEASPGDRVKFVDERNSYTVRCRSARYVVCTKPFALRKTVIYTIIDLDQGIRATDNRVFCHGYETDEKCAEAVADLESGELELSHRNRVVLHIQWVRTEVKP